MKKKWIYFFVAVFLATIAFVIIQSSSTEAKAYEDIKLTDYQKKLASNEEFMIYIYSTNCATCKSFAPTLNSAIDNTKTNVFALDVSKEENNSQIFSKRII